MLLDLCRKNEGNPFSTKIWVVGSYTDTLLMLEIYFEDPVSSQDPTSDTVSKNGV